MDDDKRIPPLPKDFFEWADKQMPQAPIFYQIKGRRAKCRCGKCSGEYDVQWSTGNMDCFEEQAIRWDEKPSRFAMTKCKICGHEGPYEWKRVKSLRREYASYWIMQRTTENDCIVRVFRFMKDVEQGYEQEMYQTEEERYILKAGAPEKHKYVDYFSEGKWKHKWERIKSMTISWKYCEGIYPGWYEEIEKSNQKYFIPEKLSPLPGDVWDDTMFILACCNNPAIEMYSKAGMVELVKFLVYKNGISREVDRKKKTPEEQLKIRKERIKDLVAARGDVILLELLQMEKKKNIRLTEEQVKFYRRHSIHKDKIIKALEFISFEQLMNRVEKYARQMQKMHSGASFYDVRALIEYSDYLEMRRFLGYNMKNTVYLFPRNLEKAHAEMVKEQNARKDEMHITSKMKRYPMPDTLLKKLEKKYTYKTEEYSIRPAADVGEIILEGRALHHCVGGDGYLSKHTNGTTTICFLRTEQEVPYITIEIKGYKIIQWYGKHDTKPDKKIVEKWIEDWISAMKEKGPKKKKKPAAVVEKNELMEAI